MTARPRSRPHSRPQRRLALRLAIAAMLLVARLAGMPMPAEATVLAGSICHAEAPAEGGQKAPAAGWHDCLACAVCHLAGQLALPATAPVLAWDATPHRSPPAAALPPATGPPSGVQPATPATGPPRRAIA